MATLLVAGLAGQLGGDDFEIRVDTVVNEGRELAHYKQGLRGTETIVTSTAVARGLTRPMIEEILASKSSTDPIPVEPVWFRLGGIEDLHLVCEYRLPGGEIHVTNIDARGKGTRVPPELRRWFGPTPTPGAPSPNRSSASPRCARPTSRRPGTSADSYGSSTAGASSFRGATRSSTCRDGARTVSDRLVRRDRYRRQRPCPTRQPLMSQYSPV